MDENQSLFELEVDPITAEELLDTARWQKMFGTVMLIIVALVLMAFVFAWNKIAILIDESLTGGEESKAAMTILVGVVILIAAVLGTMGWFIIRGAGRIRAAIRHKDQLLFNNGLADLKTFFIIYGVVSILSLLSNLVSLF
jgi:hypothetical protein